MPEQAKLKVFLCHASQDKPIVRDVYQRLSTEGWIDPWLDEEKILAGQGWEYEIENAVESADVVIVLLSSVSVTKEGYIQKEIRYALDIALEKPEGTIFIIPVRLDECLVPRKIKQWQYVDCFPTKKFDDAYKKIFYSLKVRATTMGINTSESRLSKVDTITKEDPIDFGSNDVRRMPVYFLLECGDSMRGTPLESVEQGVQLISNELLNEPQAVESINISVITYSTYAQQIVPLAPIISFEMPSLTAGGIHNLGNALKFLCDCVNKDLAESTATKKGDHKARVFWITAHNPTDNWSAGLSYLNANGGKINGIVALAVGETVDITVPRHITPNVLLISDITPGVIRQFFKMISDPVKTASRPPGTNLLPPPFEVKL